MIQKLELPFEFKAVRKSGEFEGYASVFGNVDLGGDVIEPGAFKEMVTNDNGGVVVLWQHDSFNPVGVAKVSQDEKGLKFTGKLVMEDPVAQKALAHMKAGSVRGMSIGYDILEGGAEIMKSGVRILKALKLWEISIVTFGMNPLAQVEAVKRAGQITTIRDYEDFLRDVGGFSQAQAKLLAVGGWKELPGQRDVDGGSGLSQHITRIIDAIPVTL